MSNSILARVSAIAACSVLMLSAACSSKVDDCNQAIEIMNQTETEIDAIESVLSRVGFGPGVETGVKKVDAALAKLSAVQFKTPEVQKFSDEYQTTVKALTGVCVELSGQTEVVAGLANSLTNKSKKVDEPLAKILAICSSDVTAVEACLKVGAVLKSLPDDPMTDIAGQEARVAELRTLAPTNAALQPFVKEAASVFEAVATVATEFKVVDEKHTVSEQKAAELSKTQSSLVDGLYAFCQAP